MLKNYVVLEVEQNGKKFTLVLPSECTQGEVYDALYKMRSYIVEKINAAQEADKPKEVTEPQVESV